MKSFISTAVIAAVATLAAGVVLAQITILTVKPYGGRVRLIFIEEARCNQTVATTRAWVHQGSRWMVMKWIRYEWACPYATGASVSPQVATDTMKVVMGCRPTTSSPTSDRCC